MNTIVGENEPYKQVIAQAEQTLQLMRKHRIYPSEKNFGLWMAYTEGSNLMLIREIDAALAKKGELSAELNADLYNRHIKTLSEQNEVANISNKLEQQLGDLLNTLENAEDGASSYSEKLDMASSALSSSSMSTESIKAILKGVASATQSMAKENAELNNQIHHSTEQLILLNEDLNVLRTQAETDPLTGLANRRSMWKKLNQAIEESMHEGTPLCVLMLDIDHFKRFNDTFGHLIGDRVLKLLSSIVVKQIKGKDTAARYGGEEFAVILPDTAIKGAVTLANNFRKAISAKELKNRTDGTSLGTVTISIGTSIYRSGESAEDIIARADKALYAAKEGGRNQVMVAAEVVTL